MKTNENQENLLIIYTIFLNISDNFFTSWFGINREEGERHMNKIAQIGGSKASFSLKTPDSMHNTFVKIAEAITQKYGLKII